MTAGALTVFYRFDAAYAPGPLFETMARVMTLFTWSVLISLFALLSLALGAKFEPTVTYVTSWALAVTILLPPYVLLGIAVSLALTRSSPGDKSRLRSRPGRRGGRLPGDAGAVERHRHVFRNAAHRRHRRYRRPRIRPGRPLGRVFGDTSNAPGASPATPGEAPSCTRRLITRCRIDVLLGTHGLRPILVKDKFEAASEFTEERWNSFSRIDMQIDPQSEVHLWSASKYAPRVYIDQGWMRIDGGAGTPFYRFNGNPRELDFLRFDLTALAYFIRHAGRSAVIGIGGGRDLQTASIFGFRDITGVEYNPIFVRLFARDYREFTGAGHIPGLRLAVDDARSWFARSREQFDLIQMSLIDTWAATGAGAFTLSENGLYTVNGWKRFLSRLTPNGVFTVSRWYTPEHLDETGRILSLAMATMFEMGERDPATHLYLATNRNLSTLVVGRAPLSAADVSALDEAVRLRGYRTVVAPGRAAADPVFDRILRARTPEDLVRIGHATPINLSPTWDANPFFFDQLRLSDPASMMRAFRATPGVMRGNLNATLTLLTLVSVSMLVVFVVVIGPAMGSAYHGNAKALLWSSAYFLMIGIAFMFVEITLIQRMSVFLGHPIYGLAIVLFSIILATGVGSLLSARAVRLSVPSLVGWPLVLAGYLAVVPLWLGNVLDEAETQSLLVRAVVCLATIVPAGVLMGFYVSGRHAFVHPDRFPYNPVAVGRKRRGRGAGLRRHSAGQYRDVAQ